MSSSNDKEISAFTIVKKVHNEVIKNGGSASDAVRMLTHLAEENGYSLSTNGNMVMVRKPPSDNARIRLGKIWNSDEIQTEMIDTIMAEIKSRPLEDVWGSYDMWKSRYWKSHMSFSEYKPLL
jgi:hypothetical protein